MGARVVIASRNLTRSQEVRKEIEHELGNSEVRYTLYKLEVKSNNLVKIYCKFHAVIERFSAHYSDPNFKITMHTEF